MKILTTVLYSFLLVGTYACKKTESDGGQTKNNDQHQDASKEAPPITESAPEDSSGTMAPLSLTFESGAATQLNLDAPTSLTLENGITLQYAKLNIAKIKLKSKAKETKEEEKIEEEERTDEAAVVSTFDEILSDPDTTLALKKDDESENRHDDKESSEERKKKLDEIKDKEDEALDKEAKKDPATKFKGPFVLDAITGKVEGEIPSVEILDGSYKRVQFQLKRNMTAGAEEPILGQVFAIRGTFSKDGATTPFAIDWHVSLNFKLRGEGAFAITPGAENTMIIGLDPTKWFADIDLADAKVASDGTIYINKKSNHKIMKKIHRNIKKSARVGKDANKDGKLDSGEVAGVGEETEDASSDVLE
jgi:hypothetical protein